MNAPARAKPDVSVMSFGCRLNLVESEAMRRAALAQGRHNLVIVNTCAVTAEATRQARQAIRRVKRQNPDAEIIVTGCAAEVDRASFAGMSEVTRLVGNAAKTEVSTWATDRLTPETDIMSVKETHIPLIDGVEDHTRAFLAIQNGCDHRCTFCIIPFARGASRSVPLATVLAAARSFVEKGFHEIVLTGVDLTSYGADLPEAPTLGRLVKAILKAVPGLARLRLSSVDCIEADADLVDAFASEPRLMPHLHLSLQSGDDMILKRMKRRHSRADALRFCMELRRLRPDMVFGADLIAGFPTETEAMFENSLALIEDCGLTFLHVFPFSGRPGTPAASIPPVNGVLVKERAKRLRERADAALSTHLAGQVGKRLQVLTERGGLGRCADFTQVRTNDGAPGRMIETQITGTDGKCLLAHF
jgi:threonylcarbamoyladenosine tRNA methylthiotransferase MtaB